MLARTTTAVVLVAAAVLASGCSESPTAAERPSVAQPGVTPASSVTPSKAPAPPADPIAAAAYRFLDAVFAGDTARADRQLTPAAAKQLAISGQRFAPPGSGPSSFEVGEVRRLDENHAAVECLVRGELAGSPAEESLGCLLRKVDGRWGVSGIAYEVAPDQPPTVFNFEQLPTENRRAFVADGQGPGNRQAPRTAAQAGQGVNR